MPPGRDRRRRRSGPSARSAGAGRSPPVRQSGRSHRWVGAPCGNPSHPGVDRPTGLGAVGRWRRRDESPATAGRRWPTVAPMERRHRVVVVGAGFGGLAVAKGLAGSPRRRGRGRCQQLPHVPTAAVPGRHRRARCRRHRAPGPGDRRSAPQRRRSPRASHEDRSRGAAGGSGRGPVARVRPPGRRCRRGDEHLRHPRCGRARLRAQVGGRCARVAGARAAPVRARRGHTRPDRRRSAHLRDRWRRSDRGGAGRRSDRAGRAGAGPRTSRASTSGGHEWCWWSRRNGCSARSRDRCRTAPGACWPDVVSRWCSASASPGRGRSRSSSPTER